MKWYIETNSDDQLFIYDENEKCIAEVESDWPEPARSNANLIAAAPDLLAVCKLVIEKDALQTWAVNYDGTSVSEKILAAIAKAEGKVYEKDHEN
jgi:hypothetical protein